MNNIFQIPGYDGNFNASKISSIRWAKGKRKNLYFDYDYYIAKRKSGKKLTFYIIPLESWYDLKYLSFKLFNTRKPKLKAIRTGYYDRAYVNICFGGTKGVVYEFPSNAKAEKFHNELLELLKNLQFTCQFKK